MPFSCILLNVIERVWLFHLNNLKIAPARISYKKWKQIQSDSKHLDFIQVNAVCNF